MTIEFIYLTAGILILSVIQYFECLFYLKVSERIHDAKAIKSKIIIGASWLALAVAIVINCLMSVFLASSLGFFAQAIKAISAIAPLLIGTGVSIIFHFRRWKEFHKKFEN